MIIGTKKLTAKEMAGMGLGHSLSQSLGVFIFLGFNAGLSTMISQAYGKARKNNETDSTSTPGKNFENLGLCGHYVNRAYV